MKCKNISNFHPHSPQINWTSSKSKTSTPEEQPALQEELVAFSSNDPNDYQKRLADLPSEWTIVQISELHPGQRLVLPELKAHPLRLSRFGCGKHSAEKSVRQVPKPTPLPAARNEDLLKELKSVIEDLTKLFSTPLLGGYKLQKLMCESRFEVSRSLNKRKIINADFVILRLFLTLSGIGWDHGGVCSWATLMMLK